MTLLNLGSGILAVVAIVIALTSGGSGASFGAATSGNVTNFTALDVEDGYYVDGTQVFNGSGSLIVGTSGSTISFLKTGTCNLSTGGTASINATSTLTVDCGAGEKGSTAIAGITAGDKVFLQMPTTTPTTFLGVNVIGANASSTTGFITLTLFNGTGAAYTITPAASSSIQYWVAR